MPKIRSIDTKGLVQQPGRGTSLEQSGLIVTRDYVTATVDTANGTTTTDLGISLPSACRIVAYKVSIISSSGTPAGNVTDLGFKGGDVDAIMDGKTLTAATAGGSQAGQPATLGVGTENATPTTQLMITHTDPGGAGKTSKVKVVVLYETYA